MHPVAGSELFDVIASEKRHHLLMLPLKCRRRLCGVGRGGTGGGEGGTLVGDAAHELSKEKGGEKKQKKPSQPHQDRWAFPPKLFGDISPVL